MRLLGMYVLALQVQGAAESGPSRGQDLISLIPQGPVPKLVLLILILFSVASWGIILYKLWALNRAERQSSAFPGCVPAQQQVLGGPRRLQEPG